MSERSFWAALFSVIAAATASMLVVDANPARKPVVAIFWVAFAGVCWVAGYRKLKRERMVGAVPTGAPAPVADNFEEGDDKEVE